MDSVNDFRKLLEILTQRFNTLKEKLYSRRSTISESDMKDEFLSLVQNTRKGATVLKNCFVKGLKAVEKDDAKYLDVHKDAKIDKNNTVQNDVSARVELNEEETPALLDNVDRTQVKLSTNSEYDDTCLRFILDAEKSLTALKNYHLESAKRGRVVENNLNADGMDDEIIGESVSTPASEMVTSTFILYS
jgi:hypothetical protein